MAEKSETKPPLNRQQSIWKFVRLYECFAFLTKESPEPSCFVWTTWAMSAEIKAFVAFLILKYLQSISEIHLKIDSKLLESAYRDLLQDGRLCWAWASREDHFAGTIKILKKFNIEDFEIIIRYAQIFLRDLLSFSSEDCWDSSRDGFL